MVLNKRKPVGLIPNPPTLADNAEVFVMKGTHEVFTDYEKYLKRFDWLNQKRFTDAVNGKSGLTFWEALESENKSSSAIENVFPEALRDPILRRVQFSVVGRMDDLVNQIFDEFKHDFFPGEEVIAIMEDNEQFQGFIRTKAKFPMIRGADGTVQRQAFARYFVRINLHPQEEALLEEHQIRRDKKIFTKANLRSFLKVSLQREAWNGAPWLVKEPLAIQYRLPMEIPAHLLQEARVIVHRTNGAQVPKTKQRKSKGGEGNDASVADTNGHAGVNGNHHGSLASHPKQPPPPPAIKYPIEDLEVEPKRDGTTRPELKFFTEELTQYNRGIRKLTAIKDITPESMGMLLEVWNTLNVQCEVYIIDSFTFDDFVDAMRWSSATQSCELLDEVHCAVLKLFVNEGKPAVKLPKKIEESSEEESEEDDESSPSTPPADVPARSTRSRLSFMESAADIPAERTHRAAEVLGDMDWPERIMAGDFGNGGWQIIMIGLLHQLAGSPVYQARCEAILMELVPENMSPTRDTVISTYADLNINLRISALQLLTILTIRTEKIKSFLEACNEDMTEVRKRKIDLQRERKVVIEELAAKDRERKILLPENMPESPKQSVEPVDLTEETIEMNGHNESDAEEDGQVNGRSLRRGSDRKRKRDEDVARREKERAEKAEAAKLQPKLSREFKKILLDIEECKKKILRLEADITECDNDLREANVQRTKVLGKDRYCNRYYWFERNGQPFGGLPNSSTANYGYANGRIWVQGPDEMEMDGYIVRTKEEQAEYQLKFQITVPERRRQEEGTTTLPTAQDWGFYDDPDGLDNLIGWLDERGDREKKLRKELVEWRDKIVEYMGAYRKFHDDEAARRLEAEEEQITRVSTRHKIQEDLRETHHRCLKWTNSMAARDLGHIHSRPIRPREKRARTKGVAVTVNRGGKPLSRQGETYVFR